MTVKSAGRSQGPIALPQLRPTGRGVNSAWVRRVNAVLLMQALRRHPGSSQRELAVLTGLDKATVSAVTSQLVETGLVARSNTGGGVRRLGRPAVALSIPRSAGVVFGVRLEPDRIAVVAADLGGRIIDREERPGSEDPHAAIQSLSAAIGKLGQRLGPLSQRAIGIGVPGLIDKRGQLIFAPNLHWRDVPLVELASKILAAPVMVENDTNAAAIAEREFGSCTGVDDFIYVSGHSGVGGAIFVGGRLYRGAEGLAGEFGHIRIVPGGRACGCGGRGCLEAYASVPGLITSLGERGGSTSSIEEVAMRAEAGEAAVLTLLEETGDMIGRALAGSVNALNPSHLVLGGNLAVVAPWMLTSLRNALARAAMEQLAARLNIELSPLGPDAVMMGGVALALQKVDADLMQGKAAEERAG
jgi:predicted NBD/HSP70 family sugar kinase